MKRNFGLALACALLTAIVYAAAGDRIAEVASGLVGGEAPSPRGMNLHTMLGAIASDQPRESLAAELPPHDPTVGRLAGSAGTSGGSASYTIPIALPPGRRGMQPSLSLDYSSRSGNGIAGMGWSLSGVSSLHRCPATIEQDGLIGAVAMAATDKLCLDGQRLIATAGAYGQANATYDTELDSFVRVTQMAGDIQSAGAYFKVETKSGDILWYGNNTTAANAARVVPGGAPAALSWLLVRKEDRVGNFVRYAYTSIGNGEVVLSDVYYTGFGSIDGDRSVHLAYEARPTDVAGNDQSSSYLAGGVTRQTQRLKAITTWSGVQSVPNNKVRQYNLAYGAPSLATRRSLLASVQECGFLVGQSACRPPTTFAWQQGPTQSVFHPAMLPAGYTLVRALPDYTGDGTPKVLATNASGAQFILSLGADRTLKSAIDVTGLVDPSVATSVDGTNSADFDLDGRADLVGKDAAGHAVIYFWDGPTNATTFAQAFTRSWSTSIPALNPAAGASYVGDMDGDGRADLVSITTSESDPLSCYGKLNVYRNVANAMDPSALGQFAAMSNVQCLTGVRYWNSTNGGYLYFVEDLRKVADLNGDGLPDIILTTPSFYAYQRSPSRVLYGNRAPTYSLTTAAYNTLFPGDMLPEEAHALAYIAWPDINGDGLADYALARSTGWSVRLNTGHGFGPLVATGNRSGIETCGTSAMPPTGSSCADVWQPWYAKRLQVGDLDGDGRQEILVPGAFAAAICTQMIDHKNTGEIEQYYECPEGSNDSNIAAGWQVRPMYFDGFGSFDQSAYYMDAVRFNETGLNQFQVVKEATSRISSRMDGAADLYGDGLEDRWTRIGCSWAVARACALATGSGMPTSLPGGIALNDRGDPVGVDGLFLNENLGPNGQANPDGRTPELPDLMSMVTDGMGAQTVWTYYPLTSAAGRSAGQTPLYAVPTDVAQRYVDARHIYFTSSMPVVSDMATTDGLGGYRSHRYGYSQAMYHEQGRGFQGFRSIIDEDTTGGLRTTTIFHQKFPLASRVQEVFVNALARSGTDAPIKHELYTWRCNRANRNDATACAPPSGNATIRFPFLDKKETWTFDATVATQATGTPQPIGYSQEINADDANCAGTIPSASGYDSYGNLLKHTVLTSDAGTGAAGFRQFVALRCATTSATYSTATADLSGWWLDKLLSTSTTSKITYNGTNHPLPTGTSNLQTTRVDYTWNSDRTPWKETVQPGVTKLAGQTDQQRVTTYGYPTPSYGLPTAVTVTASGDESNMSRSSTIAYQPAASYFASSATNALGQMTSVTTSARDGQPLAAVDANGLQSVMTYDVFGQLIRTQFRDGNGAQIAPDKLASVSWCTGSCLPGPQALYKTTEVQDGAPTHIVAYDLLGRQLLAGQWVWDNRFPVVLTQYDARGQVTATSQPWDSQPQHLFWTTFQYDVMGRVTQKIVPKGADDGRGDLKTTYAYSGLQTTVQVCGTADPDASKCLSLTRTTDSSGKFMETVDAQGGVTQYWLDATGNTLALKDAKGSVTRASYNAIGQRTSVSDPNQGTWSFAYDALGEVLGQTDARGIVTSTSYDKLGRPLTRNASIDITGDNVADAVADSWTYDPLHGIGQPATSQRLVNGVLERQQANTYDGLARRSQTDTVQQIASGTTKTYQQTFAYDGYYNRPKSTVYPNGESVATYYSKYGIPIRSFDPVTGAAYREVTAVNDRGSPTDATLGGGLLTDARTYRASTGELQQIKASRSATVLRQLDYQTDVFGNVIRQQLNTGATTENYTYDTLQRMTQATRSGAVNASITYGYDAAGNFTSKSDFSKPLVNGYIYTSPTCGGGPNAVKKVQLAAGGSRTYCYDADGNLTSDNAGLAVQYDHDNLPVRTTRGAIVINLAYGPDNQRTREWGGDGTKVYVDGYEDWISAGSTKVYIGADAVVTRTSAGRSVNYLLTDRLGSVDAVADATGNLVETRGSDAFGKPRTGTWGDATRLASTSVTAKGFTEHEHLNSVELIHMNGRVYDYSLGRFLSVDPFIQFPLNSQSLNPYSYILNNPLAGTDPSGYEEVCNPQGCATETKVEASGSQVTSNTNYSGKTADGKNFSVTLDKDNKLVSASVTDPSRSNGGSGQGAGMPQMPAFSHASKSVNGPQPGHSYGQGGADGAYNSSQSFPGKFEPRNPFDESPQERADLAPTGDKPTDERIEKLHPSIRDSARVFLNRVYRTTGIRLRVAQGIRTYAEQDATYRQGRSTPGPIVTYARGGQSYHNFGLALDVFEVRDNGTINWNTSYRSFTQQAAEQGFSWGGDWRSADRPHFENNLGFSHEELDQRFRAGQVGSDGYVEVNP